MVTLLVLIVVAAFISGAPLFCVMLGGAAIGASTLAKGFSIEFSGQVASMFGVGTGDQVQTLSTIPLFIYAGYLLAEAKMADRLVRFANALLGWLPGGLAIVTIGTCALFTVFTGASGVTIIALGGVLMPALVKHGYPERFSMGLIAGTGSVGLLFPPALPLFIYGTVAGLINLWPGEWDTRRFLFAGIVPGMVLIGMLIAVAMFVAIRKKLPRQAFEIGELGRSFVAVLPELAVPFGVIIGLVVIGFSLPEIAALTVLYVSILEVVITKQLAPRVLWSTSREAMAMVGAIFIIILASTVFTNYMVTAHVPETLVEWTKAHVGSRIVFLLVLNLILLLVGTVMDIFSAIVIVLPLIGPIAKHYGVDPYHLGVIFLLNLEVGYLHPPVGLNLFITSVKFQRPITEVMWATIPFLLTMIVALLIVTYNPALTVVPEAERTGSIGNLDVLVKNALEATRAVKDVPLVMADGTPLTDSAHRPIVRHLAECDKKTGTDKQSCANLFALSDECKGDQACLHKKIAKWVVDNQESGAEVLVVDAVPLIDEDGKPVPDPAKGGAQLVKHLADCDTADDKDSCRGLFVDVSDCKISPPEKSTVESCTNDAISKWVSENASGK